ncbi:MAG: trehalose-6-phosphate synthase, partial [Halanaerobium sp. MSAO_Bac5]
EFAGAAQYLDSAIKVNPYHREELADGIYQALEMDEAEKKKRLKSAKEDLSYYDINWWRDHFLENWLDCYE